MDDYSKNIFPALLYLYTERESMDFAQALKVVEGLSKPSKMPCYSYNLSALECKLGATLRKVPGSTCFKCYALRGNYRFPHVQAALKRRLDSISKPEWAEAMVVVLTHLYRFQGQRWFRWHDSGDIQSLEHLEKIVYIAHQTPWVRHWLPTREVGFISQFLRKHGEFPNNLVVRVSAPMIDGELPNLGKKVLYSAVHKEAPIKGATICRAKENKNQCGECRACWDKRVKVVSYPQH